MEYESAEKPEMLVGAVEADDVDDVEGFLEIARLPALLTLVLLDALGYPNDKGENGALEVAVEVEDVDELVLIVIADGEVGASADEEDFWCCCSCDVTYKAQAKNNSQYMTRSVEDKDVRRAASLMANTLQPAEK